MKMRGSIPDRKAKMTFEQFVEMKRANKEKAAQDADERNKQQAGIVARGFEAGAILGAGLAIPDEVPQPEGD